MLLGATKVAARLDISVASLNNWYRWYFSDCEKPENMPELPKYIQHHARGARKWKEEDIEKLQKFKDWIPKGRGGVMGDWNAQFWGERGIQALKNKGLQKK